MRKVIIKFRDRRIVDSDEIYRKGKFAWDIVTSREFSVGLQVVGSLVNLARVINSHRRK
jgi:hypothetical protein